MKIAPSAAMPTGTPTWRKVSLIPGRHPLCSFGTTLTATSAIHRVQEAHAGAGDQEAAKVVHSSLVTFRPTAFYTTLWDVTRSMHSRNGATAQVQRAAL